MFLTLAIHK